MSESTRTCAVPLWNGPTSDGRRLCAFKATRSAKGGTVPLCTFHYNEGRKYGFANTLPSIQRSDLDPVVVGRRARSSGEGSG